MPKPVDNFYNSFEANRGYTWKQDLNRLRKSFQEMTVCSFFNAFGFKVIESKAGADHKVLILRVDTL